MENEVRWIGCRSCDARNCKGCNVYTLSKMLQRGDFDCMMDEHHSIVRAPESLRPNWISVEDRLPEIISTTRAGRNTYRRSARVLCACLQADGKRFAKEGYMEFFNDYPKPNWRIPGTIHSVTHWMPLPEPPKEVANE